MKRIIRLTERDLTRIVKRVIMEQETPMETPLATPAPPTQKVTDKSSKMNFNLPKQPLGDFQAFNKLNGFKFADQSNLIVMNQGKDKYVATNFSITKGDASNLPIGKVLYYSKWNPMTKELTLDNGMVLTAG